MSHLIRLAGGALVAALATASFARDPVPTDADLQSLSGRSPGTWTLQEREFWFPHLEKFFPSRVIARGERVSALPEGAALPTFSSDGEGARRLQRSIDEFKLTGIVVLQDGKLRLERYALGHSAAGRWPAFGISASLTSTLVGAAIKDGHITGVDDLVTRYIPELRDGAYDGVTLRHLLTMTSGVRWSFNLTDHESDERRSRTAKADPGMDATVSYMRKLPRDAAPGQKWKYSTGESNLLAVIVSRATGKDLTTYASEKIWAAYGMEQDATWTLNSTGREFGGCCIQAATRDLARLGQFVLDGAQVDGRSIVADGWIEASTRKQADTGNPFGVNYGYQWWVTDNGAFKAIGVYGQQIHVDSARRLVVVINSAWPSAGGTKERVGALTGLLGAISAAIDSERRSVAEK